MATVIGFSGAEGDHLLVKEELADVVQLLRHSGADLVEVTVVPGYGEAFAEGPGFVNAARVAYLRAASG